MDKGRIYTAAISTWFLLVKILNGVRYCKDLKRGLWKKEKRQDSTEQNEED